MRRERRLGEMVRDAIPDGNTIATVADEYDAAQERGEVRAPNERTASRSEAVGVTDIGLTRKQVHEAREIKRCGEARSGCGRACLRGGAAGEHHERWRPEIDQNRCRDSENPRRRIARLDQGCGRACRLDKQSRGRESAQKGARLPSSPRSPTKLAVREIFERVPESRQRFCHRLDIVSPGRRRIAPNLSPKRRGAGRARQVAGVLLALATHEGALRAHHLGGRIGRGEKMAVAIRGDLDRVVTQPHRHRLQRQFEAAVLPAVDAP